MLLFLGKIKSILCDEEIPSKLYIERFCPDVVYYIMKVKWKDRRGRVASWSQTCILCTRLTPKLPAVLFALLLLCMGVFL